MYTLNVSLQLAHNIMITLKFNLIRLIIVRSYSKILFPIIYLTFFNVNRSKKVEKEELIKELSKIYRKTRSVAQNASFQ